MNYNAALEAPSLAIIRLPISSTLLFGFVLGQVQKNEPDKCRHYTYSGIKLEPGRIGEFNQKALQMGMERKHTDSFDLCV